MFYLGIDRFLMYAQVVSRPFWFSSGGRTHFCSHGDCDMDMKVHCPGCSKPLRVPKTSSGRKARCPSCHKVFIVPAPEELVDETISTWIEDDVTNLGVEHEKQWEAIGSIKSYRRPTPAPSAAPLPAHLTRGTGKQDGAESADDGSVVGTPQVVGGDPSTLTAIDDLAPQQTGVGTTVEVAGVPMAAAPPSNNPLNMRGSASPDILVQPYPDNLRVDPRQPHLIVVRCDQGGVCLAFDSACLEDIGFRTSMPVRCAFTGEMERRKLFARPLAFIDRSSARIRSSQEIDNKYTTSLFGGQSTRELLDVMGDIDALPKPFCFCLPYYGCNDLNNASLKCWTQTRSDGGITCFVIMPSGPVALHWLLHVNGTCGREFAKLEHDISLLDNEAWRLLGEECRKRLAIWCPFEAGEHFQFFLSDGDFGSRDKGLAGLVLTDQRLVYCKYHHRGAIDLSQPATLHIRDETDFAQLSITSAESKTKLVKLHLNDVPKLVAAMTAWPNITIERKEIAPVVTE